MKSKRENLGRELTFADQLDIEEAAQLVIDIVKDIPICIIIDAIDECDPSQQNDFLSELNRIITESNNVVKIFVSSRDTPNIKSQLEMVHHIIIQASENAHDIKNYINSEMSKAFKDKRIARHEELTDEMEQKIKGILTDKAQGMYVCLLMTV